MEWRNDVTENSATSSAHCIVANEIIGILCRQQATSQPLDQRRTDSRLVPMCYVTYDLVTIPASDYTVSN